MTRRSRFPARPLLAALLSFAVAAAAAPPTLDRADATRLLEQSTFGPTDALVAHVLAVGVQGWLAEQFAAPASRYPAFPYVPPNPVAYCAASPDRQCLRDSYSPFLLQNAFFRNAIANPDQLRQRVGFALSQIFVISGIEGGLNQPYGMAGIPAEPARARVRQFANILTTGVTLHPTMGKFLDIANNNKSTGGVQPNENYAREVLQLFSIGADRVESEDGTPILGARTAGPWPTYDQAGNRRLRQRGSPAGAIRRSPDRRRGASTAPRTFSDRCSRSQPTTNRPPNGWTASVSSRRP